MPAQVEILFTTTDIPTCMYAYLHTYMHATIRVQLAKAFSTGERAASIQYADHRDPADADFAFYEMERDSEYAPSPPSGPGCAPCLLRQTVPRRRPILIRAS